MPDSAAHHAERVTVVIDPDVEETWSLIIRGQRWSQGRDKCYLSGMKHAFLLILDESRHCGRLGLLPEQGTTAFAWRKAQPTGLTWAGGIVLGMALLLPRTAPAQAPNWAAAASSSQTTGTSFALATAADAQGNVFVTGNFTGSVAFGNTVLTSAGSFGGADLFVAKYVPATATWAWALSGGGTSNDVGQGIAVSGGSVYVTGYIQNNQADVNQVRFANSSTAPGAVQVNGTSPTAGTDLVVAKYTDNGGSATLGWTQVGGGVNSDVGLGIAVSGTNVYATGHVENNTADVRSVRFGGSGTAPGTVTVNGATSAASADLVVVKYTDNGTSAALGWAHVGGGTDFDIGTGVAVSGSRVYVTGFVKNNAADAQLVRFGGSGTTPAAVPVNGASSSSSNDLVVAKYTDNGSSAALGWTQVGGGTSNDVGKGIVASGTSVFVTGSIVNTAGDAQTVRFGGSGAAPGTVPVNGASATSSPDLVVAKYLDNGSFATLSWTQIGGGTAYDEGTGIAVSGQNVLVGGGVNPSASFGNFTIPAPVGTNTAVLARLVDASLPLAAGRNGSRAALALYPNPAREGAATLTGVQPGTVVRVVDALGRSVLTTTANEAGTAKLQWPTGVVSGLYLVRAGAQASCLVVQQ